VQILATLCYVRHGEKTLMLHRVKKERDMHAGKWNGLGGKLEAGESPEECAIREVHEESGLMVTDPILRGFISFPRFDGKHDWQVFVYRFDSFSGELQESPEGDLAWLDPAEIRAVPLWEGDRIFMDWLEGDHIFSAKFVYTDGQLVDWKVHWY
jgi:8-oxo-dGTP diphosphatase